MKYVIQDEKRLYFKDGYNDFNNNKLINTKKRKLHRKYFIYSDEQKVKNDNGSNDIALLEMIRVPNSIDRLLLIYSDSKNRISFMIVREDKKKTLIHTIKEAENKPAHRMNFVRVFDSLYLFGVIRHKQDNIKKVDVSLGYEKSLSYPFKYVFPKKLKENKVINKINKLEVLSNLGYSRISLKELLNNYKKTSEINNPIFISSTTNDNITYDYPLKNNYRDKYDKKHYLYGSNRYTVEKNKFDIFMRKSITGQYVLVVTDYLKPIISLKEYVAKVMSKFDRKSYDVYFEKFSNGANESAFEVFKYAKSKKSKDAVYILNKNHEKFEELQEVYGKDTVLAHNSIKAFIAIFNSKKLISSDLSSHLLRSLYDNSKYIKQAILGNKNKVFLQHGVSLATNIFERGYFNRKVPIAPDYIVTNSRYESNLFIKYPKYQRFRLIEEGVPNIDLYINDREKIKKDITFMLTWRPWDLTGQVEINSYIDRYLQFIELIEKNKFFENKNVNVILHPKAKLMLQNQFPEIYSEISEKLYEGDIKDALIASKVVITDYSSICFYAFAGKSNLIFFWGDKEKAEQEYGAKNILQEHNIFGDISMDINEELVQKIISNYNNNQSDEYKQNYSKLVEYTDGNNTKRVYDAISRL